MTAATDTRQAPAAATASQTNSTSATGVPAEPRLQPGWAPTGAQPPRAGSRRAAVISLLVKSGWEPEQVDRDYQLRPPTDPPSVSRLH
ncbi:MAG: hypothetical protein LBG11_03620, partial [Bifidobacteriaceae bacterium]|nr:hypothetical protein [Bifidobacteriaceae bacterium]